MLSGQCLGSSSALVGSTSQLRRNVSCLPRRRSDKFVVKAGLLQDPRIVFSFCTAASLAIGRLALKPAGFLEEGGTSVYIYQRFDTDALKAEGDDRPVDIFPRIQCTKDFMETTNDPSGFNLFDVAFYASCGHMIAGTVLWLQALQHVRTNWTFFGLVPPDNLAGFPGNTDLLL